MEAAAPPPPPVQMLQMLAGFQVSQALYVAAKLGVADRLVDGPRSVADVADTVGADAASLRRLLRTLASFGVFTEPEPGVFALTPLGRTLASNEPGSMRDVALMWMETHYDPFGRLIDTVKTGVTAADVHYGAPFFDWISQHPEQVSQFTGAMANLTSGIKAGAVAAYDFDGAGEIVDIGGADGALLAQILACTPSATGVTFDLPHVIAEAGPAIKAHGLGDRLRAESGDFFEAVPSGADTYLLSIVLHDWDDVRAATILENIRQAAQPGTTILALEPVMPAGDEPHMSKMLDLTMLAMTGGLERTEDEHRQLFERAGLTFQRVIPTPTPISFVVATV
jgi:O-methyltransferase domain/Dimerisation domain